jgi:hypothetical protein
MKKNEELERVEWEKQVSDEFYVEHEKTIEYINKLTITVSVAMIPVLLQFYDKIICLTKYIKFIYAFTNILFMFVILFAFAQLIYGEQGQRSAGRIQLSFLSSFEELKKDRKDNLNKVLNLNIWKLYFRKAQYITFAGAVISTVCMLWLTII